MKYIKRICKWFIISLLVYLFMAFLLSVISVSPEQVACENKSEIYLSTNGVHLDFIIPKAYLSEKLATGLSLHGQAKYIAFGWGDKGFYLETPTWADLKFSTAFSAMFLQGESAIHVSQYFNKGGDWKRLDLCPIQIERLMEFINDSFKTGEMRQKLKIEVQGYNQYDLFYQAKGSYSIFKTCNIWVNQGLKAAMVKTAVWSPFDVGVLYHVE